MEPTNCLSSGLEVGGIPSIIENESLKFKSVIFQFMTKTFNSEKDLKGPFRSSFKILRTINLN